MLGDTVDKQGWMRVMYMVIIKIIGDALMRVMYMVIIKIMGWGLFATCSAQFSTSTFPEGASSQEYGLTMVRAHVLPGRTFMLMHSAVTLSAVTWRRLLCAFPTNRYPGAD